MRKYWEDIETNTGRVILIKSLSAELEGEVPGPLCTGLTLKSWARDLKGNIDKQ